MVLSSPCKAARIGGLALVQTAMAAPAIAAPVADVEMAAPLDTAVLGAITTDRADDPGAGPSAWRQADLAVFLRTATGNAPAQAEPAVDAEGVRKPFPDLSDWPATIGEAGQLARQDSTRFAMQWRESATVRDLPGLGQTGTSIAMTVTLNGIGDLAGIRQ